MDEIGIFPFAGSAADWQAALDGLAPFAPLQAAHLYGALAQAAGRRVWRGEIALGGRRIGLAQALGRGGLWLMSRAPVFAAGLGEEVRRAALRRLARHLPGITIATPEAGLRGFGLVPLVTPRHHALWDLTGPEADLRVRLQAKWRNRLVAAERAGLRLCPEPDPGWLVAREAGQRRERGYRGLPAGFLAGWGAAAPGQVLALSARSGAAGKAGGADEAGGAGGAGGALAGVVVVVHGGAASYFLGWSGPEGRAAGAHNFLLWQAALRLRASGVGQLDLGDVNSESGAGLMHFKLGTGARLHALGATCLVLPG